MPRFRTLAVVLSLSSCCSSALLAQKGVLDLGVTYTASRSLRAASAQNFWLQGGSLELGANAWKGVGIAAKVAGTHTSSIGSDGNPLSLITITFGPRYRWHSDRRLSIYGEGLVGEVNGFYSLFPLPGKLDTSASSLATQVGGGADVRLRHGLAARICEVNWLRTQLPNATNNVQNSLVVGAGLVIRF